MTDTIFDVTIKFTDDGGYEIVTYSEQAQARWEDMLQSEDRAMLEMRKQSEKAPDIIRDRFPEFDFVVVTEVKIDKPTYTVDYIEKGKKTGWRLIYTTGFLASLSTSNQQLKMESRNENS